MVPKTDAQKGRAHAPRAPRAIAPDEWTDVTFEIDDRKRRLFVNGELRHRWDGADAARIQCGRERIGLPQYGSGRVGSADVLWSYSIARTRMRARFSRRCR
jgi:hypothetical protein